MKSYCKILFLMILAETCRADFPPMNFGTFPAMKFDAFANQQQIQTAAQTQGQGAATGQGSADSGDLSSVQNMNTNSSAAGTLQTSGSLGACNGGNCKLSGASQTQGQGQFQGQSSGNTQQMNSLQAQGLSGGFPSFFTGGAGQNTLLQNQFQSQFGGSGASVGSGSVDQGSITSAQNTNSILNQQGSQVLSTNIGQGAGTNVGLSGAVQATGQGQTANQIMGKTSGSRHEGMKDNQGGAMSQSQKDAALLAQSQSQSTGGAASTGNANAGEGTLQSLQSANVKTDAGGTSSSSNSANTAHGRGGLKVSGAVSANGASQNQATSGIISSLFKGQLLTGPQ